MRPYIYVILSAALLLAATNSEAQVGKRYYIDAGWQFNATVDNPVAESANGWGAYLEGGYYLTPKLAVGAFVSANTNNEYVPKRTYYALSGDAALTTDMDYSIYQVPFGATLRYRFSRMKWQPYVEAKVGAEYSKQYAYLSTFGSASDSWGFYVSPEAGVTWHPFSKTNLGFQLAVYYSYATNRSTPFNMSGINNLGFKLGLSF